MVVAAIGIFTLTLASCSTFGPALVLDAPTSSRGRAGIAAGEARCELPDAGADFERVSPAEVGVDAGATRRTVQIQSTPLTGSFRIYRHGCLIGRTAADDESAQEPAQLFSMTKSVSSLVVGRAITLGHLSLDDQIGTYVPEADAEHARLTVRELLTHTSGLRFGWLNDLAGSTEDSVGQALALPFAHEPRTDFEYAQTTVTLLLYVVQQAVGEDVQAFASRELFEPIGIRPGSWTWWRDGAGHTHGYSWLLMSPVDVARLATLVLDDGVWRGRRLLDTAYVAELGASTPTNPGYGLLTQTNQGDWHIGTFGDVRKERPVVPKAPRDTVLFSGFLEQAAFIVPSLDVVIVRVGLPPGGNWRNDIFTELLPGIPGARPAVEGPTPPSDPIEWSWSQIADLGELMERMREIDARR